MSAKVYHEAWLLRKEGVKHWSEYWGVIRGKWLQFYEKTSEYSTPELRKTLELTTITQCSIVKRNKNRFPFSVNNGKGIYYMKVDTELERYQWIVSILSAALGRPKTELPNKVPESMLEKETFRKLTKAEKLELKKNLPPPPKKEPIRAVDIKNKRRRRYAERRENKIKKKEAARLKKQGLEPEHETRNDDSVKEPRHPEVLRRAKNINKLTSEDTRFEHRQDWIKTLLEAKESVLGSSPNVTSKTSDDSVLKIKAMVHPPSSKKTENTYHHLNMAYEDDDDEIDQLPSVPVVLTGDGLLPNMVVTEVSDSDDESTDEISLNSQTGLLMLNNSSDAFPDDSTKHSNTVVVTHTVITDDGYTQVTSPDVSRRRTRPSSGTSRPTSANGRPFSPNPRPTSANSRPSSGGRYQQNLNNPSSALMERPLSPLLTKPMSPYNKQRSKSPTSLVNVESPKPVDNSTQFSRFLHSSSTA